MLLYGTQSGRLRVHIAWRSERIEDIVERAVFTRKAERSWVEIDSAI